MWALVLLDDDAEGAKVFVFNSFEEGFEAYKEELRAIYDGSFDSSKEEETFYAALEDAKTIEEVENVADPNVGENDIRIFHLVEVEKWEI